MKLTLNPMDNVRNVVRLSLDTYGLLLDIRNRVEMTTLDRLEEVSGAPEPIHNLYQRSVELTRIVARRRDALERELLLGGQRAVGQTGDAKRQPDPRRRPPPTAGRGASDGAGLHVTVRQGEGQIVIPITLRNQQDTAQLITLQATPLQEEGGEILSGSRIEFSPPSVEIPGQGVATIHLSTVIGPEFQARSVYRADIRILGPNPRVLPFRLTVEPLEGTATSGDSDGQ